MPVELEWIILLFHVALVVLTDLTDIPGVNDFYEIGLVMVALPVVAIVGGRFAPYLAIFPVVLIPISSKTVRDLVHRYGGTSPELGWIFYVILPVWLSMAAALWYAKRAKEGQTGRAFTRGALLFATWVYFGLNWAYFGFPWPWLTWGGRTANGLIFAVCAFGLTGLALVAGRRDRRTLPEPAGSGGR